MVPVLGEYAPRRLEHHGDRRLVVCSKDRPGRVAHDAVVDDGLDRPCRRDGVEVSAQEERRPSAGPVGLDPAVEIADRGADLRLGRIDEETTANVGIIHGGTAGNIVPEWCTFLAEARSHDERKLADAVQEMLDAISFAAGLEDCEVETEVHKSYRGYRFKRDDDVVRIAHAGLERAGFTPSYGLSGGAADANVFNERGLRCLNLANGMQDIHTPDERIAVDDLERMVDVTLALVDVALTHAP